MVKAVSQKNEFQKGVALFWAILITSCISLVGLGLNYALSFKVNPFITIIVGVVAFFYARKMGLKSVTHENGISVGPWGYLFFILLLNELGMLIFFYDVQKIKAKRKGQNVEGKKGNLFIALIILLMIPFILTLWDGFLTGYSRQMAKYRQQEFHQGYIK